MASKPSCSKQKFFILFIFFLSIALLLLTASIRPIPHHNGLKNELSKETIQKPNWYDVIAEEAKGRKIKIGLVNMDQVEERYYKLHGLGKTVSVSFDRVPENQQWEDYFPEWIDEDAKWNPPICPEMPMPKFEDYGELEVVVARVPCGSEVENEGVRDLFRLQVNLVVANLAVNGWMKDDVDQRVYVVFIGSCGPMWEIFRCDDLLSHEADNWVYRPDLMRLKEKVLMPVGTCQIAPLCAESGKVHWGTFTPRSTLKKVNDTIYQPREAYATILHSSEEYVCGAIALARSIIQTNSTRDLVLLVDDSITARSLRGLATAGWKIKPIERIRSPHAEKNAYNEWNYSKLRLWQLIEYDKIIFIDADLLVLENIDDFFVYPQLSAVGNNRVLFNSGVMLVEPSACMFENLMEKRDTLVSYNGGDQGFLNEVFTWWHRWPSRLNHLKGYRGVYGEEHEIPEGTRVLHYLGLKPWFCYTDYDCNWDVLKYQTYACDSAHRRWWQVYDNMPKRLKQYCAFARTMDDWIWEWRDRVNNASSPGKMGNGRLEDLR